MKFDLTLMTVLVFIVPGATFLLGIPPELTSKFDIWHIIGKPKDAIDGIALVSLFIVTGTLLDSLRVITIYPLAGRLSKLYGVKYVPANHFRFLNKDSLSVFDMITEKAFVYLRLNQNLDLSLFLVLVARISTGRAGTFEVIIAIAALVWLYISVRSHKDMAAMISGFIDAHRKF